ncbi:MAG TPA: hypothetical protein PL009_04405 [Flavipsychrobacter sp.]|nr:hypothetical protein [Flavipsychrobacter sp.]
MNKCLINFTVITISLLGVISCNRKDGNDASIAGKGGNATLRITPKHHNDQIDSCKVYIKYNTLDAANTYDDSTWATQVNGVPVATFSGLKNGEYYLYGKGWDPVLMQEVKGGLPHTISEDRVYELTLPVSETH